MVACLQLARLKTCRKIYNLLEIYTGNEIVTKYNLLFDIMTLTFCNNHCQHLFICEIYNVNLNENYSHNDNYSHLATYHKFLTLSTADNNKLQ